MITTNFVPGSPCWLDLGAADVAAAATFYQNVFGWESESMGEDDSFRFFRRDGKAVGAVGKLTEEGARSAWMVYFHTEDAESTVAAVKKAGGTVRSEPDDVPSDAGRLAQLTDPQGAQFAIWQPKQWAGLERTDKPGSLCWIELYTSDSKAAQSFYGDVFGWTTQDMPMPGGEGTYTLVTPAGQPEERMHGGIMGDPSMFADGSKPYWHPVFEAEDCDATLALVKKNGGTVVMGPEDAEGVGRLAVCRDGAGAEFVVLKPNPSEMSA